MDRLLVLSVSAGTGHLRAADAVCAAAAQAPGVTARHLDVLDFSSPRLRRLYADRYMALVRRRPELWRFIYRATHAASPEHRMERIRRAIERSQTAPLAGAIKAFRPTAILCTHFLPAELLATRAVDPGGAPVWVQVTDFDLHRMWVHQNVDGYLAPNDEVAFLLRARGVPAGRIVVAGIPVMPAFALPLSRMACAAALELDPARPTVLYIAGHDAGTACRIARRLLDAAPDFQLIVLAGREAGALAQLAPLAAAHPSRVRTLGYTRQIERLMRCADLVIGKSGGLTVAECMAVGVPMLVYAPIPGQEERNADYLLEHGAGLKANDADTLAYRLRRLLDEPGLLERLRDSARALGRPDAARVALRAVLGQRAP